MDQELQALQKASIHRVGRRRLRILLCGLGGAACAGAMALVLVLYGTPYNPVWWWVMAAILLSAFVVPVFLASLVEWVIAGYLDGPSEA